MKILIIGCGYVGCEFARQWLSELPSSQMTGGLHALTRSANRRLELESLGIEPVVGDWLNLESLPELPPVDGILVAVPHRPDPALGSQTHIVGLKNVLQRMSESQTSTTDSPVRQVHVVYLSTTGVFGQVPGKSAHNRSTDGKSHCEEEEQDKQVDEATPVYPTRPGPALAVETEQWLQTACESGELEQLTVLRLAGIYGVGRIPLIQPLLAGEPLAVPHDAHLNLIHVMDIGRILVRLFQNPPPDRLYVASDGQPVLRGEFYRELARLCCVAAPQFVSPAADDPRARRATDKRVNPSRPYSHLGIEPVFGDYRDGLAQIVAAQNLRGPDS
jgi:nucleoside-diphosphate-sugar epimerase